MDFKKIDKYFPLGIFFIPLIIYALTAANSINYWDSPEFISTSYKLEVGHAPGAPLYTLLSHVFISLFPIKYIAFGANFFSSIFGAFTVLYLFKIILLLGAKLKNSYNSSVLNIVAGAAALMLAFSHSFWTAATEAEVYTMQSFMVLLILYLGLKWRENKEVRYLIFIVFLLGLSVGVHIMTFAVLFPLMAIILVDKLSVKKILIAMISALGLYFLLNSILFQGVLKIASKVELFTVNQLGLFFNSGVFLTYSLLFTLLIATIVIFNRKRSLIYGRAALGILVFIIGYSTYFFALLRSNDAPISSETSDIFSLLAYINYEQFVDEGVPVLNGKYYNAPLDWEKPYVAGKIKYRKNASSKKYEVFDDGAFSGNNYDKKFSTILPRMYHSGTLNQRDYPSWVEIKGENVKTVIGGKQTNLIKPTFTENLKFMFNYQIGWMNLRYLLWNFAGVQNDEKGLGHPLNGNWASGIDVFDDGRIVRNQNEPSANNYYLLPLVLGLIGIIYLLFRNRLIALVVGLIFLAFGLFITLYINQIPTEVYIRERDYILLVSYIAFAMFVAVGMLVLFEFIKKKIDQSSAKSAYIAFAFLLLPILVFTENYDDHNRSNNIFSKQLAKAYLDSCKPNAILITDGDNATFPLWYLQEVENYRTDVRVINFSMLSLPWYANKLTKAANKSLPLALKNATLKIMNAKDKVFPFQNVNGNQALTMNQVLDFIADDNKRTQYKGKNFRTIPSQIFQLECPSSSQYNSSLEKETLSNRIVWRYAKDLYDKQDLVLLGLIADNVGKRPIHFTFIGNVSHHVGLDNFLMQHGLTNELVPVDINKRGDGVLVDTKGTYEVLMANNAFSGILSDSFLPSTSKSIGIEVLRSSYYLLATTLLNQNKIQEAEAVLNRCLETLPNDRIPYREYMYDAGKTYYKFGKPEIAKNIINTLYENLTADIKAVVGTKPSFPRLTIRYTDNIMLNLQVIVRDLAKRDERLHQKLNGDYSIVEEKYQEWKKNLR